MSNDRLDVGSARTLGRARECSLAPGPRAGQVALQSDATTIQGRRQPKRGIGVAKLGGAAQRLLRLGARYGLGSIEAPVEGSVLLVEGKPRLRVVLLGCRAHECDSFLSFAGNH